MQEEGEAPPLNFVRRELSTERYTGLKDGIPYFIRRFGARKKAITHVFNYPLFMDRDTGEVIMFDIDEHRNPHILDIGSSRRSGKTTLADIVMRYELQLGGFGIIFDPKGEYPTLPYPNMRIKRVALQDEENPVLLKPSKLSKDDWTLLVEIYAIGKGDKVIKQVIMKTVRELSKLGIPLSIDNIADYIQSGNIKKIKPDSMDMFNIESFLDEVQETGILDEENGMDLLEIMREYDLLIVDIKSPEINEHIALVAQHIISSQLFKLKVDSDPRNGKYKSQLADVWERRVIVLIDEAGDPENGLINTEHQLACKRSVERIFTKFAYANIIGLIVTQHIQNIATPVINNCSNVWVGTLSEDNAFRKVANMSQMALSTVRMLLNDQEVGDFLLIDKGDYIRARVILPSDWREVR